MFQSSSSVHDKALLEPAKVFRSDHQRCTVTTPCGDKVISVTPQYLPSQLFGHSKTSATYTISLSCTIPSIGLDGDLVQEFQILLNDVEPAYLQPACRLDRKLAVEERELIVTYRIKPQPLVEKDLHSFVTLVSVTTSRALSASLIWSLNTTKRCYNCCEWVWGPIYLIPSYYDVKSDAFVTLPQAHCSPACVLSTIIEDPAMEPEAFQLMFGANIHAAPPRSLYECHIPGGLIPQEEWYKHLHVIHERYSEVTTVGGEIVVSLCLLETLKATLEAAQISSCNPVPSKTTVESRSEKGNAFDTYRKTYYQSGKDPA